MRKSTVKYIDKYHATNQDKKEHLVLTIPEIINFMVNYTLQLHSYADANNIKACIKLIFDCLKEEYDEVIIDF